MAEKNLGKLVKRTTKVVPIAKPTPAPTPTQAPTVLADAIIPVQALGTIEDVKDTVKNLLQDIAILSAPKSEKEPEAEEAKAETTEERQGSDWLQEQVILLRQDLEQAQLELAQSRDEYDNLYATVEQQIHDGVLPQQVLYGDGGDVKQSAISLFNELQSNLLSMGLNQETGQPNFIIYPIGFLLRLIEFFPFLEKEKRF